MKKPLYTQVKQFLCDDDFIRFVLEGEKIAKSRWDDYLTASPRARNSYLRAIDILTHVDECLSLEDAALLKERIYQSLNSKLN